jgi:hypothetical protein
MMKTAPVNDRIKLIFLEREVKHIPVYERASYARFLCPPFGYFYRLLRYLNAGNLKPFLRQID